MLELAWLVGVCAILSDTDFFLHSASFSSLGMKHRPLTPYNQAEIKRNPQYHTPFLHTSYESRMNPPPLRFLFLLPSFLTIKAQNVKPTPLTPRHTHDPPHTQPSLMGSCFSSHVSPSPTTSEPEGTSSASPHIPLEQVVRSAQTVQPQRRSRTHETALGTQVLSGRSHGCGRFDRS